MPQSPVGEVERIVPFKSKDLGDGFKTAPGGTIEVPSWVKGIFLAHLSAQVEFLHGDDGLLCYDRVSGEYFRYSSFELLSVIEACEAVLKHMPYVGPEE